MNLTSYQRALLEEAIEAHDAANDLLGHGDPSSLDARAYALMDAFTMTGIDTRKLQTWTEVRDLLAESARNSDTGETT